MRIACSPEVFEELMPTRHLYETEIQDLNSFWFFRQVKNFDLIFIAWPTEQKTFWLRAILSFYRSKKLVIFVNLQEAVYKLSSADKQLLFRANRIICPNLESARHGSLSPIYWKAPEKFREIPFGVDLKKYSPRESFFPSQNPVVAKFKAILNLVTKKVIKKGIPNILISCQDSADWQEVFDTDRIKGRILYFDGKETDQIKRLKDFQEADIFVAPKNEGPETVRQIIEALACGLAIIAPRGARLNNVFNHDKEGLFFKPDDNNDLIERITILCNDEEKREAIARASRKLAETHYDKKQREEKVLQIIKELEK